MGWLAGSVGALLPPLETCLGCVGGGASPKAPLPSLGVEGSASAGCEASPVLPADGSVATGFSSFVPGTTVGGTAGVDGACACCCTTADVAAGWCVAVLWWIVAAPAAASPAVATATAALPPIAPSVVVTAVP